MSFGNKDKFHFRAIVQDDEINVRNIIYTILEEYGLEPDESGVDSDLYNITEYYSDSLFGVVELSETKEIIGSFALYPLSAQEVELRKMYLKKEFRGNGIGSWIINFCEAFAQNAGYGKISLETASVLEGAIQLYKKKGYQIAPQNCHTDRCDILMTKLL